MKANDRTHIIVFFSLLLVAMVIYFMTYKRPASGDVASKFGMRVHPVTGEYKLHNGIDLSGEVGDPVYAPANGIVDSWDDSAAGGNEMFLRHAGGLVTGYAHLSQRLVEPGKSVRKGQKIGEIGATGRVTGPHLHFTMKKNGEYIDPGKYFR